MESKLVEWVPMKRGSSLPANAVYAGMTRDDGDVYVGKMDNSPGKINLKDGVIYNFWSQNYSSRSEGEVLLVNGEKEWIELKYGQPIPEGAVCAGRDYNNDRVWVAKDVSSDEPGKLTCLNSNDLNPKMCRLWCHSYWRTADVKIAKILVVKRKKESTLPPPIAPPSSPDVSIDVVEKPTWGNITQFKTTRHRLYKCFMQASITKIVKGIMAGTRIVAGELTYLSNLLNADIHAKIDNQNCETEEGERSVITDKNKSVYLVLFYKKKNVQSSFGIEQLCSCMLTNFSLEITYAIFHPTNQPARNECESFNQLFIEDILHRLRDLLSN
jgi:hypothetical protein